MRYFYETAKVQNMSHAAKELLISQPALSKAIAQLEEELEMDLFYRNGKRITLNSNGEFLFKRAERIFAEILDLERGLREFREQGNGELSIVTTLPYTFTNILNEFLNFYPTIKYKQVPLSKDNLEQFIEYGKFDLCITTEKLNHPNVEWLPLFNEEIFLTVPSTYPEAKLESVHLSELRSLPFIGLTAEYRFRQLTDNFCQENGYTPEYQVEVEEATTILQLVKNGRGAAFTPETSMNMYDDKIKNVRIENGEFTRTIGLLKHKYTYTTAISKAFIQHCYDYFGNTHK
ncbi:LysR family transcriptional regulator [Solibacillus kalamii]|uniref:LysR family transcriptional regulator n=1 Tax=Solibacillus kalamii TaxID=1748298 RepID=UPI0023BAC391|nr:LysR family transcriptional regulator [Solibacillus kalamii]